MRDGLLEELLVLAGGLAAGDDGAVGQRIVADESQWAEGFVEGVRQGQRVAGECLHELLERHGDLHC